MIRKILFITFLIIILIITTYYYVKKQGYFEKLDNFIISYFGDFASVKQVEITGNSFLSKEAVLEIININKGGRLYKYSAKNIREQLLTKSGIKDANVRINYSGIIKIEIDERKAFAIWWNNNSPWLIDEYGNKILKIKNIEQYNKLIVVFGKNIQEELKIFLDLIKLDPLYKEVKSTHYIGNRRWDVYLDNNIVIKLPEKNAETAFRKAKKILKSLKYRNKVAILDLRLYSKRIYLKLK